MQIILIHKVIARKNPILALTSDLDDGYITESSYKTYNKLI